jgi:hypothetical protein
MTSQRPNVPVVAPKVPLSWYVTSQRQNVPVVATIVPLSWYVTLQGRNVPVVTPKVTSRHVTSRHKYKMFQSSHQKYISVDVSHQNDQMFQTSHQKYLSVDVTLQRQNVPVFAPKVSLSCYVTSQWRNVPVIAPKVLLRCPSYLALSCERYLNKRWGPQACRYAELCTRRRMVPAQPVTRQFADSSFLTLRKLGGLPR